MKWTSEISAVNGFYWFKLPGGYESIFHLFEGFIHELSLHTNDEADTLEEWLADTDHTDAQFQGPIAPDNDK